MPAEVTEKTEVIPEKAPIDPDDETTTTNSILEASKEVSSSETIVVVVEEKGTRDQPFEKFSAALSPKIGFQRCRQKLDAELESTSTIPISMVAHMVNKPYSFLDETGADQKVGFKIVLQGIFE